MALRMRARFWARATPSSCFGAFGQRMRMETARTIADVSATHVRAPTDLAMSVRADRPYVLQRHGDAVAGGWAGVGIVDRVAAVFEGHAVAGAVAADEVALLEERSMCGIEVELDV